MRGNNKKINVDLKCKQVFSRKLLVVDCICGHQYNEIRIFTSCAIAVYVQRNQSRGYEL